MIFQILKELRDAPPAEAAARAHEVLGEFRKARDPWGDEDLEALVGLAVEDGEEGLEELEDG